MSLTNIDKFEKACQVYYTSALLFMPAWWLRDNFLDQSAPAGRELACCNVVGVLCGCIFALTYWCRTIKGVSTDDKTLLDYVQAGCWGTSGLLTLWHGASYKTDKMVINFGLQLGMGAAFLYQGMNRKAEKKE
jgi:hypothetical protein